MLRAVVAGAAGAAATAAGWYALPEAMAISKEEGETSFPTSYVFVPRVKVPAREAMKETAQKEVADVLVIGGGATGCGAALDAVTRGLSVVCVERDDFASGTSSRSTKMIHGGVRYLEAAVKNLDLSQLGLVWDALHERKTFMQIAPFLTNAFPIMMPVYTFWEGPYYWAGMKLYDLVAGSRMLYSSYWMSASDAERKFPMIAMHQGNKTMKGAIVYFDGQFNDSRMNVGLAITAATYGAQVINHTEVQALLKDEEGKVGGARVRDVLSGEEYDIRAKVVVNATGPFTDHIRQMEDPDATPIIMPSSGVHLVLPKFYSPSTTGLIIPRTKDGRVVFLLPWMDYTIAGTTDSRTKLTYEPQAHQREVEFILQSISEYLRVQVRRSDVKSAWAGIRPLCKDPNVENTSALSRDHIIHVGKGGMVTIGGGKWTTYRLMAEQVIDKVLEVQTFHGVKKCRTATTPLLGAEGWNPSFFTVLAQHYTRHKTDRNGKVSKAAMDPEVANHLSKSYGTCAIRVCEIAEKGYGKRLAHGFPILEAEVVYSVENEMAQTVLDFVARRTRLAFLNAEAATRAVPRVVELMGEKLQWTRARRKSEAEAAYRFLKTMAADQS